MEFQHIAEAFELPDSSGRKRAVFRPRGFSSDCFLADVTIVMESVGGKCGSKITLKAFSISRDKLICLDGFLAKWLENRNHFAIELAQDRWARLGFTVGQDPDYISSDEKPAFRIDVDWCGIAAVAVLVVDQSCIRLFHEGVSGWLRLGRATAR